MIVEVVQCFRRCDKVLILYAFLYLVALETMRNLAWHVYDDDRVFQPIGLLAPALAGFLVVVFIGIWQNRCKHRPSDSRNKLRLFPAIVIVVAILSVGLFLQVAPIYELGIIITVQYFFSSVTFGALYYLNRFEHISESLEKASNKCSKHKGTAVQLVFEQCKLYFDKIIVFILAGGASVGVMMTILWTIDDPLYSMPERVGRAARSAEIVASFGFLVLAACFWAIVPLMNLMYDCVEALHNKSAQQGETH